MPRGSKPKHIGCLVIGCDGAHEAKGYCNKHYLRIWKHGSLDSGGPERGARGAGWLDRNGYRYHNETQEHVLVAEKAIGRPLPKGAVIHHIDRNPANNSNGNLVVCQNQAYHLLIHMRQAAYEACGNASWRRCPYCRKHDDPTLMREYVTLTPKGNVTSTFHHKQCYNKFRREARNDGHSNA